MPMIRLRMKPLLFVSLSLCSIFIVFHKNRLPFQAQNSTTQEQITHPFNDPTKANESEQVFAWNEPFQSWTLKTSPSNSTKDPYRINVWPDASSKEDRIINQLKLNHQLQRVIQIFPQDFSYPLGQQVFLTQKCLVNNCHITYDSERADVLVFQNSDVIKEPPKAVRANQIWIAYLLESPHFTFDKKLDRLHRGKHEFNWTASYRTDSDIVTPYSKFLPFEHRIEDYRKLKFTPFNNKQIQAIYSYATEKQKRLIQNKSGKVAWFVSNCNAANNRLEYAKELSKYIQVDIYGKCGDLTCEKQNQTGCLEMINKNYKFYLSFENSNCRQYITEKLYRNAYGYNDLNYLILPIVMGPPKEDYEELVPPHSFLHVTDFESPKELAGYLSLLDLDHASYYSYFHWKTMGRFVDTKFMCRVCAMMHEYITFPVANKSYPDVKNWWNNYRAHDSASSSCQT